MTAWLKDFSSLRPEHEVCQEKALEWMARAHSQSESLKNGWEERSSQRELFYQTIKEKLSLVGLGKERISQRGTVLADHVDEEWQEKAVYRLTDSPHGLSLDERMAVFEKASSWAFDSFYPEGTLPSPHLIHVSCTGYASPSAAQKLVSQKGVGAQTMVTHAYHMGCYGSIPALRMAQGHLKSEATESDIVHTELCTLHMDPSNHSMEQLVVQNLFGDGFIKYTVGREGKKGLKIVALHEKVIENSLAQMTWGCRKYGFYMTLAKEVPVYIARSIEAFLLELSQKAKKELTSLKKARFAIHPGGPKIIQQIAQRLELEESQIAHSRKVLHQYGNMSSATLPHVWASLIDDEEVKSGEAIVSMAFGPGLTVAGALFEKG